MLKRSRDESVALRQPTFLKCIGRVLPAGVYHVVTDEELIEGLSFPAYRRVSTMMMVPSLEGSALEMHAIDPEELAEAQCSEVTDPASLDTKS